MTRRDALKIVKDRNHVLGETIQDLVELNSTTSLVCYLVDHYESLIADMQIPKEKQEEWELARTEYYKKLWKI